MITELKCKMKPKEEFETAYVNYLEGAFTRMRDILSFSISHEPESIIVYMITDSENVNVLKSAIEKKLPVKFIK